MSQSRWKGKFREQNKIAKSANFVSKFKAKHAIVKHSQCLEESKTVLKAKLVKDVDLLTRNFLLSSREEVAVHVKLSFLTPTAFSFKIL